MNIRNIALGIALLGVGSTALPGTTAHAAPNHTVRQERREVKAARKELKQERKELKRAQKQAARTTYTYPPTYRPAHRPGSRYPVTAYRNGQQIAFPGVVLDNVRGGTTFRVRGDNGVTYTVRVPRGVQLNRGQRVRVTGQTYNGIVTNAGVNFI